MAVKIIRELPISRTGAAQVLVKKGDKCFVVSPVNAMFVAEINARGISVKQFLREKKVKRIRKPKRDDRGIGITGKG